MNGSNSASSCLYSSESAANGIAKVNKDFMNCVSCLTNDAPELRNEYADSTSANKLNVSDNGNIVSPYPS